MHVIHGFPLAPGYQCGLCNAGYQLQGFILR
jgi:hypothetical protein